MDDARRFARDTFTRRSSILDTSILQREALPVTPLEAAAELLGDRVVASDADAPDPWVEVRPADVAGALAVLRDERGYDTLNDLTAVDYLETDAKLLKKFPYDVRLQVVYRLSSLSTRARLTVRVSLPRPDIHADPPQTWDDIPPPTVPTVSHIYPAANWHERECYDLFGVVFEGHPKLERILCAEDWVGHPLRKDYEFPEQYEGIRAK